MKDGENGLLALAVVGGYLYMSKPKPNAKPNAVPNNPRVTDAHIAMARTTPDPRSLAAVRP